MEQLKQSGSLKRESNCEVRFSALPATPMSVQPYEQGLYRNTDQALAEDGAIDRN